MLVDQSKYQNEFSLKNKLGRFLWSAVWIMAFKWTPRCLLRWRLFLLRCFGAEIGDGSVVYSTVKIWAPWNLKIGDYTAIGPQSTIYNMDKIILGDHVTISQGVHLCTGSHDISHPHMKLIHAPIEIQDMVWVCAEAFVHPGKTIETGAVVSARSVVVKNIDAWSVVSGNPAVFIKKRNVQENGYHF
jgi:putative colanic acid biosynthesis acetyltransferase WcaF